MKHISGGSRNDRTQGEEEEGWEKNPGYWVNEHLAPTISRERTNVVGKKDVDDKPSKGQVTSWTQIETNRWR